MTTTTYSEYFTIIYYFIDMYKGKIGGESEDKIKKLANGRNVYCSIKSKYDGIFVDEKDK